MRMDWVRLLSEVRAAREEGAEGRVGKGEAYRSAFEADYDRVVFSLPFRRLARKTQVHPLALNDHVHTRLTHSLEVAAVGRSLARRLGVFLEKRGEMPAGRTVEDLTWVTQAACLAHDLGNPPFGHAGEFALREWTREHGKEMFGAGVEEGVRLDWEIFEGNAQGFRLAARADNAFAGYMRLTYATLGAMTKYPWDSGDARAREKGKYNVFSTERGIFQRMARETGMAMGAGRIARHPVAFLTEAADDICYRILDLEDAVEMRILEERRVREIYLATIGEAGNEEATLAILRGLAIKRLIEGMWEVFEREYEAIMCGEREEDLRAGLPAGMREVFEKVKGLYEEIFADRVKVAAELGAYQALGRIVEALCRSTRALADAGTFKATPFLAQRCLELAWGRAYAVKHERQTHGWWLHQVMDFVAGLTDTYARQMSREIDGG